MMLRWSLLAVGIGVVIGGCGNRRGADVDKPMAIVIPHPGYLNECVPQVALRAGEQRRVDFECEGGLNETERWWKESDQLQDASIKVRNEDITAGMCGAVFRLSFATPATFGEILAQPGKGCGKFRRYCVRVQRPRKPGVQDDWTVSLAIPPCGDGDRGTH